MNEGRDREGGDKGRRRRGKRVGGGERERERERKREFECILYVCTVLL